MIFSSKVMPYMILASLSSNTLLSDVLRHKRQLTVSKLAGDVAAGTMTKVLKS